MGAPGSKFKCGDNVLILKGAKKIFVNHKATIVKYLCGKKKWGLQLANSKKIAVGECFLRRIETSQSSTVASTTEAPKQDRRLQPTTEAPTKSPTVAPAPETPTVAPTTEAPTVAPITQFPTVAPTTES